MIKDTIVFIMALITVIGIIALIPILTIWSINTLFNLGIPITFGTCVAVIALLTVTGRPIIRISRGRS